MCFKTLGIRESTSVNNGKRTTFKFSALGVDMWWMRRRPSRLIETKYQPIDANDSTVDPYWWKRTVSFGYVWTTVRLSQCSQRLLIVVVLRSNNFLYYCLVSSKHEESSLKIRGLYFEKHTHWVEARQSPYIYNPRTLHVHTTRRGVGFWRF